MALVTIQYSFLNFHNKTMVKCQKSKKIKIDHRYIAFRKLKKKVKIL